MRKIDWYILRKFMVSFFFCLLLFTVIAVAVDSSEKTDDFVKANLSTREIINQYYLGFVPYIWSLLFPLFVFLSVIWFTSRMASRSEFIAILASGTSYNRILRAYIVGGIFLALMLWFGSRYWIPKANSIRSNFQTRYVDRNDPTKNQTRGNCPFCFYMRLDSSTFIGIRDFDTSSKTARGFFLEKIRNDEVYYNLRSDEIRWDTAKKKWLLINAVERFVDSMKESIKFYATLNYDMNIKPSDLRKDDYLKDKFTTPELVEFIGQQKQRGTEGLNALQVERYRRSATPASVLLLTLIGVVIASRRNRGGSGVHIALGIAIAAVFILSDRFSTVFSIKSNFPPLLAAWLPNIVFGLLAYGLYRRTPK
jgi:lipopolysaccharide export system permease protein